MSHRIVTRADLRELRCERCSKTADALCGDSIYLTQRCHPGKGVRVAFHKDTERLMVTCHVCGKPVAEVAL